MKKIIIALILCGSINAYADESSATAQVNHTNAYHGSPFTVYGYHSVHLVNNTDSDQDYTYTYTLCVNYYSCKSQTSTAHLKPGQVHDEKGSTASNQNFRTPGSYGLQARTEVFANPHVDVSNYNTVTVY